MIYHEHFRLHFLTKKVKQIIEKKNKTKVVENESKPNDIFKRDKLRNSNQLLQLKSRLLNHFRWIL